MRDCCSMNQFSSCCEGRECQSYAAQVERRRASRKSQRDAEATVRAKAAAYRAMLVVLAVASICAFLGATAHTLIKTEKTYQLEARI